MSAREKLIRFVTAAVGRVPEAPRDPETGRAVADLHRYVDQVLAEHAHELAEKIRNSEHLRDFTDDHMGDVYEAANLIDLEVSSDGS